jgi:hypothetical protein
MEVQSPGFTFCETELLYFYLWGCMKEKVYAMEVQDCNDLIHHADMAAATSYLDR